jgi:hypothetical protein
LPHHPDRSPVDRFATAGTYEPVVDH